MKKNRNRPQRSSDTLPYKPTRETSRGSATPGEALGQRAEPAGIDTSQDLGRERVDPAGGHPSERHEPHATPQDREAGAENGSPGRTDGPALPANASGTDAVDVDDQDEPVDESSMYERRPERDKDRPPSRRAK